MDLSAQVVIEIKLNELLDNFLGAGYFVDTDIYFGKLYVRIFKGHRKRESGQLLSRLNYDLTVLEPGLEEAAKIIYLDWIFS